MRIYFSSIGEKFNLNMKYRYLKCLIIEKVNLTNLKLKSEKNQIRRVLHFDVIVNKTLSASLVIRGGFSPLFGVISHHTELYMCPS